MGGKAADHSGEDQEMPTFDGFGQGKGGNGIGSGERGPHFPIFQNEHLFDIMKIRLAMPARSGGWRLRGRIHPVRRKYVEGTG